MKKLFLFLMLGIALVSFGGCDPINPPEVVKYTITATYDSNVTISPDSVVVEKGDSAILNVTTKLGYTSTVKVNGTVIPLTSSNKLTLSNVTSDMKVEATSRKNTVVEVKIFILTAKSYGNGTITPDFFIVDSGKSVTFTMTPDLGYLVDLFKVNNTEVSLTSNVYTNPSVSSCDTLEVTFKKIKLKQFTLTTKSYGNGTIYPEVAVVDSGKYVGFRITPNPGYLVDIFKVNNTEVSVTSEYTNPSVSSDEKLEVTFKEEELSPYFFNTKWRVDSTYCRPIGGTYVPWGYNYPGEHVIQFTSHGNFFWLIAGRYEDRNGSYVSHWSIDETKNPVRLYLNGREYKIELLTEKKLILSNIQKGEFGGTPGVDYEVKETYIPEP